jgi:PmbA protein
MAWIDQLLHEGQKAVDEVEVFYVEGTSVSADLKKKNISLATTSVDCGLGIRTIHKGRIGSSSTNNPDKWEECLNAAIASGKLATFQEWGGLPDPARLSDETLSFDSSIRLEPDLVVNMIGQMLEGAEQHPAEVTAGSASLSSAKITLANSHGVRYTSLRSHWKQFINSQQDMSLIMPVSSIRWIL